MRVPIALVVVIAFSAAGGLCSAAEWYVGPMGQPMNKGTKENPWDLKSVLSGGQKGIQPGDTIWVGMGTYSVAAPTALGWDRAFQCNLNGEKGKPIIVRALPGERATIDGALWLNNHDVWFWGLEVMTSTPRVIDPLTRASTPRAEGGINTKDGTRCKFINMAVHDNNQGFSWWVEAVDSEIYGCLIYHNGVTGADRGHGHGIYTQNKDGVKRVVDNVLWDGYYYGMQCYGSGQAYVYGYHIEGNIFFSNGMASTPDGCTNCVVGGGRPSKDINVVGNVSYMHPTSNRVNLSLYYTQDLNSNLVCKDNYCVNGRYAMVLGRWDKIVGSGNHLFGRSLLAMAPMDAARGDFSWNNNEYVVGTWPYPFELGWSMYQNTMDFKKWQETTGLDKDSKVVETAWRAPRGVTVIVRPNQYEQGRANIAVMNWDRAGAVLMDLSGVLKAGQPYRIFNVQKLWEDPVAQGIYDGKPVAVPTFLSWLAPEFDAYLLLPTAQGEGR
jgi:hypothetical protein